MAAIDTLDDKDFEAQLQPIWNYLAVDDKPKISDVIFVFGGIDLAVPARAADLFNAGFAPLILISGSSGPFSKELFDRAEALVFKDKIMEKGVPESSILIEDKATNTLENVLLGMAVLQAHNYSVKKAILVGKPFLMRRCLATFHKHYPSTTLFSCPPQGSILQFCDRGRKDFANRLLLELKRLEDYSAKGDIFKYSVPKTVEIAVSSVHYQLE